MKRDAKVIILPAAEQLEFLYSKYQLGVPYLYPDDVLSLVVSEFSKRYMDTYPLPDLEDDLYDFYETIIKAPLCDDPDYKEKIRHEEISKIVDQAYICIHELMEAFTPLLDRSIDADFWRHHLVVNVLIGGADIAIQYFTDNSV